MDPQVRAELQRIDEIIARLDNSGGEAVALEAILKNRAQSHTPSGTAVLAGGTITSDTAITTVGPTGKVRISASYSGVGGGAAAGIHAFLQVQVGGGPLTTVYNWVPRATGLTIDGASTVFEFDSGAPAGTQILVHWQTTALDDTVTLGGTAGAGIEGATVLLEELP